MQLPLDNSHLNYSLPTLDNSHPDNYQTMTVTLWTNPLWKINNFLGWKLPLKELSRVHLSRSGVVCYTIMYLHPFCVTYYQPWQLLPWTALLPLPPLPSHWKLGIVKSWNWCQNFPAGSCTGTEWCVTQHFRFVQVVYHWPW